MSILGNMETSVGGKNGIVIAAWSNGSSATGTQYIGFASLNIDNLNIVNDKYFDADTTDKKFVCKRAGDYKISYFARANRSGGGSTYRVNYTLRKNTTAIASGTGNAGAIVSSSVTEHFVSGDTLYGTFSGRNNSGLNCDAGFFVEEV